MNRMEAEAEELSGARAQPGREPRAQRVQLQAAQRGARVEEARGDERRERDKE